ncbi:MAG: hypothetical protein HeimC3_00940 [Candidatus Heimdallarchaeota archaeon LC_3]|nr:MAG: hypothetical protein HeimC3_00940 [Candidatus Heimdallarchaeota archaeon LC_3]
MESNPYKDTAYRGLLYTAVTDTGPKVIYNLTQLDEDHTFPLSVQAFTLLGLGSGSRTAGSWMEYCYGPLPFPTGRPLNTMIFSFLVEGSDSMDERVKKAGRSAALVILVTKQFKEYDKLRDYLNEYLPKWIKDHKSLKEKHFKQLNNVIEGKAFFKLNLQDSGIEVAESMKITTHDESTTEVSDTKDNGLKKVKNKFLFMEKLLELDNLSKSLLILYQTTQNPTITELTKISGSSRIMTSFSLRKYVKNGIVELNGDNIRFL